MIVLLATSLVPIPTLPPQMLPSTMPVSLTTSSQQNTTYYPMQVFYYPTSPISPSIYLQTGQMHPTPMTLVLRGEFL